MPRSLVDSWAAGQSTVGASCKIPSALVAEAVAAAGFDYIYIDQQHGVFDDVELLSMLQAVASAGAAPVTRVPANRPELIHKALDFGADGIIVPLVENAADAARALDACRYPPVGRRSYGVLRPRAASSNGMYRPACIVLVETVTGVANLDAIARTGVDAIMVGPHDLALSLGLSVEEAAPGSPRLLQAIDQVLATCEKYGVVAGIGSSNGHEAAEWLRRGFRLVNVGNDLTYIRTSLAVQYANARSALPPPNI